MDGHILKIYYPLKKPSSTLLTCGDLLAPSTRFCGLWKS